MAPREWNAYVSLNITSRDSQKMTCVGNNRFGKRCHWDIDGAAYHKIRGILDAMETRPPNKAVKSLEKLAGLSLCRDFHQNQAGRIVEQWESAIIEAEKEYEKGMGLRRKIQVVQEKLGDEEAKTQALEKKLKKLQLQVGNQAVLGKLQEEIDGLRIQLAEEQATSTSVRNQLKTALSVAKKSRFAFLEREKEHEKLSEENAQISCQLAARNDQLELANTQLGRSSTTSARLEHELSVKSTEYQLSLSQMAQTINKITAERDNLHGEVAALESQLRQSNEQVAQMGQNLERAIAERTTLSSQAEDLTRELDIESKASSKYESDLLHTRAQHDALSKALVALRAQLDLERQKSSKLVLDLAQAGTTHTALVNEKSVIQSQLKTEYRKNEQITVKLNQLKAEYAALSTETNELRTELASEQKTCAQLRRELSTAKDELCTIKLALGETQSSLEIYQGKLDLLETSAAEREKDNSALIARLTDEIEFLKNHIFKNLFISLVDTWKRSILAGNEWIGNVRSSKRMVGEDDPEMDSPA